MQAATVAWVLLALQLLGPSSVVAYGTSFKEQVAVNTGGSIIRTEADTGEAKWHSSLVRRAASRQVTLDTDGSSTADADGSTSTAEAAATTTAATTAAATTAAATTAAASTTVSQQLNQCQASVCGEGQTLKANLPSSCTGCTAEDCCDDLPQCGLQTEVCKAKGFRVNVTKIKSTCANLTCTTDDCCERLDTCTEEVCSNSSKWVPMDKPPEFCISSQCTPSECCNRAAYCPVSICEFPKRVHVTPTDQFQYCNKTKCTEEECCKDAENAAPARGAWCWTLWSVAVVAMLQ